MDSELVQYILKKRNKQRNKQGNKLLSREEIQEEIKESVINVYREFLEFENNKTNIYETLEKLNNYTFVKNIIDLEKGDYIRFLNTKHFYDIKLNVGGFIENIDKNLLSIINNNKYYKIKFNNNTIYKKLKEEDLVKLEIIDILEKN
jgi:hypothetical protein